jgi:predicted HTH transcriptional regulator
MKTQIDLRQQIEQLIQNYFEESRKIAEEAIAQAFSKAAKKKTKSSINKNSRTSSDPVRSPGEISALSDKLYETVCKTPGETMAVLAKDLGLSGKELRFPMVKLKKANKVRFIGHRNGTRYFPLAYEAAESVA